jgi:hypothetical protein
MKFGKAASQTNSPAAATAKGEQPQVISAHPKVLLVDMPAEAGAILEREGFNVRMGSFGRAFKVLESRGHFPAFPVDWHMPNLAEQEVVIIDQTFPPVSLSSPDVESAGQQVWASLHTGEVDGRPRTMLAARGDLNRILNHGGVVIVFAAPKYEETYRIGAVGEDGRLELGEQLSLSNWSFLPDSINSAIEVAPDSGHEMSVVDRGGLLTPILRRHFEGGRFVCTTTFQPSGDRNSWIPLITQKYGQCVGGMIMGGNGGMILILPQFADKGAFLLDLLRDVLPELRPKLYPAREGGAWVHRDEYELPDVGELLRKTKAEEESHQARLAALQNAVRDARNDHAYLYDLVRETDVRLVAAVKRALAELGFKDVVDVDEQMRAAGETTGFREDLQIKDASPVLIIDVKGIGGFPSDDDSLQASKHAHMRMQEWDRADVRSLAIINHQRGLPGLERENTTPFRPELVTAARQVRSGLLTAWDLYRLVRNKRKLDWTSEQVQGCLFRAGRIEPIPSHYNYVGDVEHVYEKANALSVRIKQGEIHAGDRVGLELPIEFEESTAESLQVNKAAVAKGVVGDLVGVKLGIPVAPIKLGTRVYAIRSNVNG